jgi:hypothetical protein
MATIIALPGIGDFPEGLHPKIRIRHSRKMKRIKMRVIEEVIKAGFKPYQVAAALRVPLETLELWRTDGHRLKPSSVSKAKALRELKQIARKRLEKGYAPATTASWWMTSQEALGWKEPRAVFRRNPRRVRASIKPRVVAKRIQTELPGSPDPDWVNIPGILGT